jgi:hypothetical protein
MDIHEQIEIMKAEARITNRAGSDGIRNWTPEARAKSLAIRRARGSVWGWDKRARASLASPSSEAFDRSMDALSEDAEDIKKTRAIHDAGGYTLEAPNKQAEAMKAKYLEAFKEWYGNLQRVDEAISDFNEVTAVMGGLTSGVAQAQRGTYIGQGYGSREAQSAARKVSIYEKAIRRNFEKRNADHLRKYPEDRAVMMDMVAEKAEYYSAQPAQKVEIEKAAYRQIRDTGSVTMRETPKTQGADYKTLLDAKRNYVREREAVRPQLQPDEVAYPAGNGIWIGRLPSGDERVISAVPEGLYNRWSPLARAMSLAVRRAKGSVWGWDKRKRATAETVEADRGKTNVDEESKRKLLADEAQKQLEDAIQEEKAGYWDVLTENIEDALAAYKEKGVAGMSASEKQRLSEALSGSGELSESLQAFMDEISASTEIGEDGATKSVTDEPADPEESEQWGSLVTGFKTMIEKGDKPTIGNLQAQFEKDKDEEKFKLATAALVEAWHTDSLDKFQDKFGRDPKNNNEFRTFQKKNGVPAEFIGD